MKISIVTATLNSGEFLPGLIESLQNQTDKDFEWVVADGASSDSTLTLLQSVSDMKIIISSERDFGIYNALNRAIALSSGQYYIVAGADDRFTFDAIENFRRQIEKSHSDIITARVMYCHKPVGVKRGPAWLFGQSSFISAHSVGTAFKKDLHDVYGYYSKLYPIAADQCFVLKACAGGAICTESDFIAGELGQSGISSIDRVGNAAEVFRIQVAAGHSFLVQTLLLILRLIRSRAKTALRAVE